MVIERGGGPPELSQPPLPQYCLCTSVRYAENERAQMTNNLGGPYVYMYVQILPL